jgi:hypothetical protein
MNLLLLALAKVPSLLLTVCNLYIKQAITLLLVLLRQLGLADTVRLLALTTIGLLPTLFWDCRVKQVMILQLAFTETAGF